MKQRYFNIHDKGLRSPLYRLNENNDFYFLDADYFNWILAGHVPDSSVSEISIYEITKKEASLLKNKIKHNALAEKLSK